MGTSPSSQYYQPPTNPSNGSCSYTWTLTNNGDNSLRAEKLGTTSQCTSVDLIPYIPCSLCSTSLFRNSWFWAFFIMTFLFSALVLYLLFKKN